MPILFHGIFLRERLGIELKWVNIDDNGNLDPQSVIDAIDKKPSW